MRATFLLGLAVIAACGESVVGSEPPFEVARRSRDGGTNDTKDDNSDAPGPDGGLAPLAGRCDPIKPFDPPELETSLEPAADTVRSAVVSPGELEIHYLRYTSAGSKWELRRASRVSRDEPWGSATTIDVGEAVAGASLAAGGLKLYWWTIDSNFVASRTSLSESFGNKKTFGSPNDPQIFVVAANDTAYHATYVSDAGAVEKVILRATMNGNGSGLIAAAQVPNLHARGALDGQPVLNTSETALYFSSNRTGGKGLADVWVARRGTKADAFGPAVHLPELSTEGVDGVSWVSDDDCVILVERAAHIYRARRPL